VCGTDGKTYSNACRATAAGATVRYKGPCKVGADYDSSGVADYESGAGADYESRTTADYESEAEEGTDSEGKDAATAEGDGTEKDY
jgi:hypothetical protein